ncbi:hypothetical protein KDD17_18505 [Sulfitobacter albidus]|uniref:Uncharacterized protein n=1 Tax=Sulfitobacter albidus TaxID=2829501 RepID=A0A975JH89_9RHOB|nr:hypothetical protein [Sulfitobacter albidus]QUJ78428.1 hypothetical protein KDD17_18505 [Sulfitobacter albidus]
MQYPDTSQRLLVRFLEQLYAAVRAPGADPLRDVLDLMRRSGIRAADIADFYVPVVAHRLGQGWCDDTLDFVQVSLGCARLQSLLQRLDASWYCPDAGGFGTGVRLAVIVPRGEQHSLGAHILTGQLRRAGCAVDLLIDLDDAAIVHHLGVSAPDATLISASRWLSLDSLHTLVRNIRGARGFGRC